jgi:hypothetical protein
MVKSIGLVRASDDRGSYVTAFLVGLLGVVAYAILATGILAPDGTKMFGRFIYNYYFLSLIEGRFDVPLRIATLEGHYAPDGTSYIYHGVAPLVTRLLAWPFVDLREVSLARMSVCFFAILGSIAYQITLTRLVLAAEKLSPRMTKMAIAFVGMAIWFAGPGLLLAANGSIYNEVFSIGYAAVAVWIGLMIHVAFLGGGISQVLIPAALCVTVLLHARVHVAVGLSLGSLVLGIVYLRQAGLAALRDPRVWVAVALVMLSALGFLGLNMARFGNPFQVSGTNSAVENIVQYGFAYWSSQLPSTPTLTAFEDGTFYWRRILPNLFLYAVDFPRTGLSNVIMATYRDMTSGIGWIRVELPRIGFAWLWAPWLAVVICAIGARQARPISNTGAALALLVGGTATALFMLSYGTISLRYRVDVWPGLIALALCALPACLTAVAEGSLWRRVLLGLGLAGGVAMSLVTAAAYSKVNREQDLFSLWDRATCEEMVLAKGFKESDLDRLCSL